MPNWVFNTVRIEGSPEDLLKFKEHADKGHEAPEGYRQDGVFSFWNFVQPKPEILEEYWGEPKQAHGLAEALKMEGNHWYEWNNRNWGTKWDACNPALNHEDPSHYRYDFDTAWAPPEPVFQAMVAQWPSLTFAVTSIEEQGWGVTYEGKDGTLRETDSWDIPDTHAEYVKRQGYCHHCEEVDDLEWMFEDCPKKQASTIADKFDEVSRQAPSINA